MFSTLLAIRLVCGIAAPPGPMIFWHRQNNDVPRYSRAENGDWSRTANAPQLADQGSSVVLRACPVRSEFMAITMDQRAALWSQRWDGQAFGDAVRMTADVGTGLRPFDAAYEQQSGRLLVVYWDAVGGRLMYVLFDGARFSMPASMALTSSGIVRLAALASRTLTNDIILTAILADGRVDAAHWNGAAWSATVNCTTNAASRDAECCAAAFTSSSGTALVVYGEAGQPAARYRLLIGGRWSPEQIGPTLVAAPIQLQLAPHPRSDAALLAAFDGAGSIQASGYTGTTFMPAQLLENSSDPSTRRPFDVAYEPGGHRALLAYAERGQYAARYRVWDGQTWSMEATGPRLPREPLWITVAGGCASAEAYVVTADSRDTLSVSRWDGSTLGNIDQLDGRLASSTTREPFSLAVPALSPVKVLRWREVPN